MVAASIRVGNHTFFPTSWELVEDAVSSDANGPQGGVGRWTFNGSDYADRMRLNAVGAVVFVNYDDMQAPYLGVVSEMTINVVTWSLTVDSWTSLAVGSKSPSLAFWFKAGTGIRLSDNYPVFFDSRSVDLYELRVAGEHFKRFGVSPSADVKYDWMSPMMAAQFRKGTIITNIEAWEALKERLAAHNLTLSIGSQLNFTVFQRGWNKTVNNLDPYTVNSSIATSTPQQDTSVSCTYYKYTPHNENSYQSPTFYPQPGGFQGVTSPQAITVEANATTIVDLEVPGYTANVQAPNWLGTSGAHADKVRHPLNVQSSILISGKDGYSVSKGMWESFGGSLSLVALNDLETQEFTKIRVIIHGPNIPRLSPFKVALTDGENDYPSLWMSSQYFQRVETNAVSWNTVKGSIYDGVSEGQSITNRNVMDISQAYEALYWAAVREGSNPTLEWNGISSPTNSESWVGVGERFFYSGSYWIAENITSTNTDFTSITATLGNRLGDLKAFGWGTPRSVKLPAEGITLGSLSLAPLGQPLG